MKRFVRITLMIGIAIGVGVGTVYAGSLLTATSGEDWIWFEGGDGYILFRGKEGKKGGGLPINAKGAISFFETDNTLELFAVGDVFIEGGKDVVIILGQ